MTSARQPRSLRNEIIVGAAIALGVAFPAVARADDAGPPASDTVVVTGQRPGENPFTDPEAPYRAVRSANGLLTEDLLDTPKTITVIPDALLDDLGASTFRDLFRAQPGVTLGTGEGGNAFGDRIFIRGFDARNDVYIDGVRDPGVGSREVFAVQQIEVLKGPSSAFGGRGSAGGAVSLISKQPGATNSGDIDITLGDDETRRVALDVNRVLSDDLAVRVNLMTHEGDTAGRDHVFNDRWGAALAVAYTPIEPLRIGFDYYHLSTEFMPDWGLPYDVANNRPFNVDRNNFFGVLSRDFGETFSDIYTGTVDYAFSDAISLHSVLRYGQSKNAYTASAPEQPNATLRTVNANAKRRDAITESLTQQSHLTMRFGTGGIGHTLVAGYELAREETLNRQRAFTECAVLPCTGSAANPTLNLDHPDATIPFGSATAVTARPVITVETAAIYLIDTIKLSPHWQALAGVRYDDYSAGATGITPARASASQYVNWHGGLVYKPGENSSLYVSYSSASNPPCEQLDAFAIDYGGCDPRIVALDPVSNRSVELGAKINLFGHFDVTAALFQIDRTGVPITAGTAIGLQDQRVKGIEFTAAGNITPSWSVFGGLTLIDPKITDSPVGAQIGGAFPNVSDTSFALTSRHQITDRLHLGATANYNSEKYGGTVVAGDTQVPGYWRYDLFGGLDLTDRIEVSFNVLNLTDEVYFDALYRSATPFSYIAPGRSALVTIDIDF